MGVCFGSKKEKPIKDRLQIRPTLQSNSSRVSSITSNTNFYLNAEPFEDPHLSWFALEQFFNLISFHNNDFTTSDIILWDMRKEKTENIFKRTLQINYLLFELHEAHKLSNLKRFTSGKKILLLLDKDQDLKEKAISIMKELNEFQLRNKLLVLGSDMSSDYSQAIVSLLDKSCLYSIPYLLVTLFHRQNSYTSIFIAYDQEEKYHGFKSDVLVKDDFDFQGFKTSEEITSQSGVSSMKVLLDRLYKESLDSNILIRISPNIEDSALIMLVTLIISSVKKQREDYIVNIFKDNPLFKGKISSLARSELFGVLQRDLNIAYT